MEPFIDWREALRGEEEELQPLFTDYAVAMCKAQAAERAVASLLVALHARDDSTWSEEAVARHFAEVFAQPFGMLLRQLESRQTGVSQEVIDRLRTAKELRDHLAHRFFVDGFLGLFDGEQRKQLRTRLETADAAFDAVLSEIPSMLTELVEVLHGITAEELERFRDVVASTTLAHPGIARDIDDWSKLEVFVQRIAEVHGLEVPATPQQEG